MKITFIYPGFERHAEAHPEIRRYVPGNEYIGPPSLGIASVAGQTPEGFDVDYIDDRVNPFDIDNKDDASLDADIYALSFFTPAATRALELGDALRARGKTVIMGGIFPTMMPQIATKHCDALAIGEGEAIWPQMLADFRAGRLKKIYDRQIADLNTIKPPRMDLYLGAETDTFSPDDYPVQLSRGCPLACDACVLPKQMGKNMRFHSDDNLHATLRALGEAGKQASLTEDTSFFAINGARRKLMAFLKRYKGMQGGGTVPTFSYVGISMPMVETLDQRVLESLKGVGIDRFYLVGGFDPITRMAFGEGDPKALARATLAIRRCQDAGVPPYVSFLVGNATDDPGTFDRMLEFCHATNLDLAEFCISTPYPGTPIWHRYEQEGRIFDRTWKHYNDANVVFKPHQMSADELFEGYMYLWREFYRGRDEDLTARELNRQTIQF